LRTKAHGLNREIDALEQLSTHRAAYRLNVTACRVYKVNNADSVILADTPL